MDSSQEDLFEPGATVAPEISFTKLKIFDRCPLEYRWRYLEAKEKSPPGGTEIAIGRATHYIVHRYFASERRDARTSIIEDILAEAWERYRPSFVSRDSYDWQLVQEYSYRFLQSPLAGIEIVATEQSFKKLYNGFILRGRVDLIGRYKEGVIILDLKVNDSELRHLREAENKFLQPIFYYWGIRESIPDCEVFLGIYYFSSGDLDVRILTSNFASLGWQKIKSMYDRCNNTDKFPAQKNALCSSCVVQKRGRCPAWLSKA